MPNATAKLPGARQTETPVSADTDWRARFRSRNDGSTLVWLWAVIKVFCRQNIDWIVSAGVHALVLLCIAGIALHQAQKVEGIGIEAGNVMLAEQAFENVLGNDIREMGGGGKPFEAALQTDDIGNRDSDIDAMKEFLKIGTGSTGTGDGGSGGGTGGGTGTGTGPGIGAGFFGTTGAGKSFVYVVDMSGSMTGRRFDRAKAELVKSINKLNGEQKFYIYFFNDRTFPLFDPKPAKGMIPATSDNKSRASRWIGLRHAESTTNPNYALQQALEMRPEVIFLLTDGELDDPDAVRMMIRRYNKTKVVIHTIAFENEDGGQTLEAIAQENDGIYRFVK
jgi:hypothetical protein